MTGLSITAAHVRELLARLGALGLTAPDGGSLILAITGSDGELLAALTAPNSPGWAAARADASAPSGRPPPPADLPLPF